MSKIIDVRVDIDFLEEKLKILKNQRDFYDEQGNYLMATASEAGIGAMEAVITYIRNCQLGETYNNQ